MSTDRCRAGGLIHHHLLPLPINFRPIRGARRLRLRIDERRNVLTLTAPKGLSRTKAINWAVEQREWIDGQLRDRPTGEPFLPGVQIPIAGIETLLRWSPDHGRVPALVSSESGQSLTVGGPEAAFPARVERWLRKRAADLLSRETEEIGAAAGLKATAVSVGDASSRWGSCSSNGRIRYSWRLLLADPAVRRMVVAHEVAHLRHLHHGPEFKKLEAELFAGDVRATHALLRASAARLRGFGRHH